MQHRLSVHGTLDATQVRRWLARPVARLRQRLAPLPEEAVRLRTVVREVGEPGRVEAKVVLRLPGETLAAHEEGADARAVLRQAFRKLHRRLGEEKTRLPRRQRTRRSAEDLHRAVLERAADAFPSAADRTPPGDLLEHALDVQRFVEGEIGWLEASGEVVPGEIDPRDVVDAALDRAFRRFRGAPSREELFRGAVAALRAERRRIRESRQAVHLEEDVPEVPPQEKVSTLGAEILDFHQPDEDLRMEDLIADLGATPEEVEAGTELAEALRDALGALPGSWRQALHLAVVHDLDTQAIAEALELPRDAVEQRLAVARGFLRARLEEAGVLGEGRGRGAA